MHSDLEHMVMHRERFADELARSRHRPRKGKRRGARLRHTFALILSNLLESAGSWALRRAREIKRAPTVPV